MNRTDRMASLLSQIRSERDLLLALLPAVFADLVGLVVRRTLLMLGRHAHILRRAEIRYFATPVQLTLHRCPFRGRRLRDVRELSSHDWPGSKRIQLLGEIAAP